MFRKIISSLPILALLAVLAPRSAHAQWAVIDVNAIVQLAKEVATLQQQLATAQAQLNEARTTYQAMTGDRGMEGLLAGTNRNYLPTDWADLAQVLEGASSSYGALAASEQSLVNAQAVLSAQQVAALSPTERQAVLTDREHAALLQAMTRDALSAASARFAALQELVNAIPTATDQKGILDLEARIAAEQGMLENESIKLNLLYETQAAERAAEDQQIREEAIAGIGSLRNLPPMGL
jgi:type IV secretion system protein VirB5